MGRITFLIGKRVIKTVHRPEKVEDVVGVAGAKLVRHVVAEPLSDDERHKLQGGRFEDVAGGERALGEP
jgi:hypothetical protein